MITLLLLIILIPGLEYRKYSILILLLSSLSLLYSNIKLLH